MLSIVTGSFHPELESALVSQVRSLKQDDPLAPLAIIVPSHQLARRVKWLLAVEERLSLLDVRVLTFHDLAKTVISEVGREAPLVRVNGFFREELLRYLVDRRVPGADMFQDQRGMKGLWTGLWATVQDLKEARLDPSAALSALEERRLETDDPARLDALLRLYAAVLEMDRTQRFADEDDLAALAMERAAESAFLKRMVRILYYGFYDLTQGQLDLFKTIAAGYPTTLFFPLQREAPAYQFAQRFFEAYIQGVAASSTKLDARTSGVGHGALSDEMRPAVRATCRIVSAIGPEDEVAAAAKEILRLIEDQRFDLMEIGVVARTLDSYLPVVRRVFEENRIPFTCPAGEPLIHEPLVKTIIRFLRLPVDGFPRPAVVDVLTSPAYRVPPTLTGTESDSGPRPDLWDWATRRLGIIRGNTEDGSLGDWLRLEWAAGTGLDVPGDEDMEKLHRAIAPAQLALLFDLVKHLHGELSALPARGGWSDYTEALLQLIPMSFHLPAWESGEAGTHAERVQLAVKECLRSVANLDHLQEDISLADWVAHVVRVLERSPAPSGNRDLPGVQVLDAMGARGVPFRALFVIGLNEKAFPRFMQEDAFLRDADRESLARDLGYKIPRKLEGFDEERLLFALLLRSAKERLYLSYQRADRDGKTMVPSGYLAELAPQIDDTEWLIKRRPTERWAERPFHWSVLTPREAGLQMILGAGDRVHVPSSSLTGCLRLQQASELFEEGLKALAELESMKPVLTSFDGLVGPGLSHWRTLETQGVSPTSLERYAQCPFKYFAEKVLRLDPLDAPASMTALDARARGDLCHDILRAFYTRLHESGVPPAEASIAKVAAWLADAAAEAFARFEAREPVGFPLLWELAREDITGLVRTFIQDDLEELRVSGYRPSLFEVEVTGRFGAALPERLNHVPVRGRLDRVDVRRENGAAHVRVVDYKYTESNAPKLEDRDLVTAALRGKRLQPPLYLLAARNALGKEPAVPDAAALYFLAPYWPDGPVVRKTLTAVCGEGTVQVILDGVRGGRFFIMPDDYCKYCEFSSACRRTHHPTKWRRRDDPHQQILLALREQKAGGE
nr:exodeoxyribonuclease V subunit gamma [Nitrospirota bacterium]